MYPSEADYYLVYLRINGCYFWFTILQITTTVLLLACLYLKLSVTVSIIEIVITFMVAIDIIFRYFTEGTKNFFQSWDNRINIFIWLLLISSVVSDLTMPLTAHHDGGLIASVLLFTRYTVQISRLCKLIIESKKALEITKNQTISLDQNIDEDRSQNNK